MKHIALGQKQKLIPRRTKPEMASNTLLCLILVSLTSVAYIARASVLPLKHIGLFSRQRSRSVDQAPCGGDVTVNGTGFIKSPRFPLNYPVDILCEWKLCVKQGSRITLKFTDFEVEPTQGCSFDALEVFSGDSTDVNNRLVKLCGNELPDPIVSTSHELLIRFRSDFSVTKRGFKLQYEDTGCGQTFVGDTGVITSPNHPDHHPLSLDCLYDIRVSNGSIVALAFSYFDLEPAETHSGCVYDHIEVFDGSVSTASSLGKFCGNTKPALIRSTSNELLLKFHSDQSITRPGFVASYTAESPVIADACLVNNGGCSDICSRTDYGRICSCREGFSLDMDGATCRDINECVVNNGGCSETCFNTLGGFMCSCREGFTPHADNKTCVNENECATGNHKCTQLCRDSEGSYYCECHKGYRIGADRLTCEDENECKLPKSFHHCQQTCVNTPGSYYCMCEDGFRLSANGRSCRDVDECLLGGVRCEQRCVNIPGRYFCDCYHGYHRDVSLPHKCVDTDECREGRPDCHKCFNLQGSYRCECDAGYTAVNNQTRCADVDECSDNNGNCSQICINIEGDRLCECRVGYEPTDPESRTCRDIDECATNNGKGDCEYACANTDGSFRCSCPAGYSVGDDGLTCYDIDECQVQNGQCSQKCENKPGSHKCDCFDGFVNLGNNLTDVICIDIDECFDGIHECDSLAKCHNTAGNYTCQCPDGFYSEWKDCIDVDECSRPEVHECQQLCNNTAGSFYCSCNDGFALQGDNKTCIDIDECTLSKCEKDCVNSNGSYRCTCPAGYQLAADGHHCEDINECLDDNGSCDHRCVNENGSYSCACRRGFKLLRDEKTCRDIDECQLDTACCNQECTNTEGSYNCTCQRGYSLISNCTCADTDECQSNNGGCQQICINNRGSYACSCNSGFLFDPDDPTRCVDINECLTDNGGCHHNCSNTPGSYQCTCHPTFRLQMDGKTCGHCPTCNDFESLLQTVEILKKKLDSIEVWRQSTNSPGCIFELEFRPNGTSWKRDPCEVCYCEGNAVRCERISGCQVPTSPTPTPAAMRHSIPYIRKARTTYNDDEDEEEVTSGSGDLVPTAASNT
ncbi:uncharacterized protein LOC141880074 [Acropora palmata]|uniref:uncharacterized protein LOC141880074 n=1 Tax=Acropora palmata TaxID=6131 RepID=UPI003DA107C3